MPRSASAAAAVNLQLQLGGCDDQNHVENAASFRSKQHTVWRASLLLADPFVPASAEPWRFNIVLNTGYVSSALLIY